MDTIEPSISAPQLLEDDDETGAVQIVPGVRPYVLAMSAASLLYIAMSDLIPDLHRGGVDTNAARQVLLIATGIGTIVFFERMIG